MMAGSVSSLPPPRKYATAKLCLNLWGVCLDPGDGSSPHQHMPMGDVGHGLAVVGQE
jgi:hypothetical protein